MGPFLAAADWQISRARSEFQTMAASTLSIVRGDNLDREFLAALRETPLAQKIVGDQKAAEVKARTAILAEIERLDTRAAKELPPLRAGVEAVLAEIRAAERIALAGVNIFELTAERAEEIALQKAEAYGRLAGAFHPQLGGTVLWSTSLSLKVRSHQRMTRGDWRSPCLRRTPHICGGAPNGGSLAPNNK
jgi:hypothetical protein